MVPLDNKQKNDSQSDPGQPVANLLKAQLRSLEEHISKVNHAGNIEGLFVYYVLHNDQDLDLDWHVNPITPAWLEEHKDSLNHTSNLAVLGYGLHFFGAAAPPQVWTFLKEGLQRLKQRDPFPEDRVSFTFDPVQFLGLALAAKSLGNDGKEFQAWLVTVLNDGRCQPSTPQQGLIYAHVRYVITEEATTVDNLSQYADLSSLALIEWGRRNGTIYLTDPRIHPSDLQKSLLTEAMMADTSLLLAPRAAVIWGAIRSALQSSVSELVLSRNHVGAMLYRFEAAMRRWRWDDGTKVKHAIQWEVSSEREVQDITWLMLRPVFDDLVDEETLPKLGHSSYRSDFGILSLRLLIEVKYVRKASDFKAIEKEIMEDAVAYLLESKSYDSILVFIYDHSASVQEHELTTSALRKLPQIEDVIIVSRPSQLPFTLGADS